MKHVEVDTPHPVDDAHQTIEADPGVVMDWNLEGFFHGSAGQGGAALRVGKVDLRARMSGNLHPEVAWQREHGDLVR